MNVWCELTYESYYISYIYMYMCACIDNAVVCCNMWGRNYIKDEKLKSISQMMPKNVKYTSAEFQNKSIDNMVSVLTNKNIEIINNCEGVLCTIKCDETKNHSGIE